MSVKAAGVAAAALRRRIILGELQEGDALPHEDALLADLGVSKPTLRQAIRILESESLVTVRRGARGGIHVSVPRIETAAGYAATVLEYRGTTTSDLFEAAAALEGPCAAMLARSRTTEQLERLRTAARAEAAMRDDPQGLLELEKKFAAPSHSRCVGVRRHTLAMWEAFVGSEAVASGRLSAYALRSRCVPVYPDIYLSADAEVTAVTRAHAAWLWSRRQGVLAGQSAAALHGAKWVKAAKPAELIYDNRHRPVGIRTWADRLAEDEVEVIDGIRVTTPARTALDLACRYPVDAAVAAVDALARATNVKMADVELLVQRYPGRRGIRNARGVLDLVDAGSESPRETWLRLLLIRAGYPRPTTQIPVYDEYGVLVAVLDMGWEDIKVAADYDGDHHRDPVRFNKDIRRHDEITDLGWIDVRVTSRDTEGGILQRIAKAWARRT